MIFPEQLDLERVARDVAYHARRAMIANVAWMVTTTLFVGAGVLSLWFWLPRYSFTLTLVISVLAVALQIGAVFRLVRGFRFAQELRRARWS